MKVGNDDIRDGPSTVLKRVKVKCEDVTLASLDEDFKYKCRDKFLYEWASERVGKPIYCLVLVAIDTLTDAALLARTDDLKRKIFLSGPASGAWKHSFIAGCVVFNIAAWNKLLSAYPVSRTTGPGGT